MKTPGRPISQAQNSESATPSALFIALRDLLLAHKDALAVVHDTDTHFYANCNVADSKGKPQFFGAVKVSANRHALHFMPVYDFPELLAGLSPALKKHMQGKSCFNFDVLDPALLQELQKLIEQGVRCYKAAGKL
jgi:hypothetical protein